MNPNPHVVIPPAADLYQIVQLLGRLEGRIDAYMSAQARHELHQDTLTDRVNKLEHGYAKLLGAAGVIGALASVGATFLQTFIGLPT